LCKWSAHSVNLDPGHLSRPAVTISIPDGLGFCHLAAAGNRHRGLLFPNTKQTYVALSSHKLYDLRHPTKPANVRAMSINITPRFVAELKPKFEIKVDLDERSFLFPAGKSVSQLLFLSDGKNIFVEAVYPFNQSRTPPRLASLNLEDAREFGRRLIEAVHCARTQLVVTQGVRISINVVANGYHVQFGDMNNATELFLGTNCIWRVCQGLLRVTDLIAPVESN
jgi:hypothetical protein